MRVYTRAKKGAKPFCNILFQILYDFNFQSTEDGTGGWTFSCPHGANECIADLYQSCLLDAVPDVSVQVEAMYCISADHHPHQATEKVSMKKGNEVGSYFNKYNFLVHERTEHRRISRDR